eukprot:s1525_g13.t1
MLILWSKYMNNGIQIHKKIKLALKLNCIAEDLLVEYKGYIALPEEPARKFKVAISGCLLLLDEIQQHFDDDDPSDHPALFRLTEKCHFIQHADREVSFHPARIAVDSDDQPPYAVGFLWRGSAKARPEVSRGINEAIGPV